MESHLPKPKSLIKKSKTIIGTNIKKSNENITNIQTSLAQTINSTKIGTDIRIEKNVLSNNGKSSRENKHPSEILTRSKSTVTSLKSDNTSNIKRPGTVVTSNVATKKPKVQINANIVNPRRSIKCTLKTRVATNKPNANNTNKSTTATSDTVVKTVNKWDLKGRLELANTELNKLRGTHKELLETFQMNESIYKSKAQEYETLNAALNKELETLKTNESIYKSKAQEYETLNVALNKELETIKKELQRLLDEKEDFMERLKRYEEAYKSKTNELEEFQCKWADQRTKLEVEAKELKIKLEHKEKLIQDLTTNNEELRNVAHRMDKERRILHNTIQEMKGNIRVFCRVRPRTPKEASKPKCFIRFVDECTIEIGKSDGSETTSCSGRTRALRQEFSFDKVFPHTAAQADIFEELSLLVQSALEGYNVCVFAYGQTGSGKTYTMEGKPGFDTEGMIPRTVRHIFKEMKEFELLGWEYRIEASFLEIYNEHIVDLLDSQCNKVHEIRMRDTKGHDLYVSNLQVKEILNAEELHECLFTAQRNRAVAATNSNERSSRSHSVARIRIIGKHKTKQELCIGNLNLVDLAGSERLRDEEAARTAETKNINKSLANLGNVILALLRKQEHVPYRNSKLTHLLMPSLGGNSKTLMLLNISPLDECYNETLNSLRFASNVNNCKVNVKQVKTVLPSIQNISLPSSSLSQT